MAGLVRWRLLSFGLLHPASTRLWVNLGRLPDDEPVLDQLFLCFDENQSWRFCWLHWLARPCLCRTGGCWRRVSSEISATPSLRPSVHFLFLWFFLKPRFRAPPVKACCNFWVGTSVAWLAKLSTIMVLMSACPWFSFLACRLYLSLSIVPQLPWSSSQNLAALSFQFSQPWVLPVCSPLGLTWL